MIEAVVAPILAAQPKLPDYCRDPENCNGSCQREIACNH